MTEATREQITKLLLVDKKMAPSKIIDNLERLARDDLENELNIVVPESRNLYNWLQTVRNKETGKAKVCLGSLAEWCLNRTALPEQATGS